jgi:branched-chain amino acid aminotransferase
MVTVFEIDGAARIRGTHASMAAASADLPEGAYTTLRTYGGERLLRLDQHVRRLEDSVALLGRPGTLEPARVRRVLAAALQATRNPESRIRLTFGPPRLFAAIEPFEPLPDALYRDGARCVTVSLRREEARSKDTRFIAPASAAYQGLPPGVQEGLMLGEGGAILEGLSSNFFALRDGVLHTEEARALPGVTRSLVLELLADRPFARTPVRTSDLPSVSECFITSVSREILPVVQIDEQRIGDGRPGPLTRELMRRFAELVEREAVPPLP